MDNYLHVWAGFVKMQGKPMKITLAHSPGTSTMSGWTCKNHLQYLGGVAFAFFYSCVFKWKAVFLGVYMSISADLPITYWEKLDKERKELAITPDHETSPPGSSGPGFSIWQWHFMPWHAWQGGTSRSRLGDILVPPTDTECPLHVSHCANCWGCQEETLRTDLGRQDT